MNVLVAGGVLGRFIVRPVNRVLGIVFGGFNKVFDWTTRVYGQAVQAYEATLIPDQTPFDREIQLAELDYVLVEAAPRSTDGRRQCVVLAAQLLEACTAAMRLVDPQQGVDVRHEAVEVLRVADLRQGLARALVRLPPGCGFRMMCL